MYLMVAQSNIHTFMDDVHAKLMKGWILYGTPFSHNGQYCQALTQGLYK